MEMIKHKILSGFPCNNNNLYCIMTEDYGLLMTTDKESFDKSMLDGYIEINHDSYPE